MTRTRLLIHSRRMSQQRRAHTPRTGPARVKASAAGGHLAQQFEQHRPFGGAQAAV